jgi:diacylglycerol kinase family enzyme
MRVLLVVNSAASSVTARRRVIIQRILGSGRDLYVAETKRRGHATALARAAVRNGTDAVVVLGGDGTLNEVATALAGTRCALAALPGGSTNVFARTIGLPEDPVGAAAVVASSLRQGSIRPIGLGQVNGRYFCFHTGIGWDAALVEIVERHAELKRYAGHPLFILAGMRTFLGGYDRRQGHFRILFDDGHVIEEAYFCLVMNSDPYTFVGSRPFTVCPAADLHHPLSVIAMTRLQFRDFVPIVLDALSDRRGISPRRHLQIRDGVSGLRIERLTSMPYQVDGDHLDDVDHLEFRHHPDALGLVVPVGG